MQIITSQLIGPNTKDISMQQIKKQEQSLRKINGPSCGSFHIVKEVTLAPFHLA